MNLKKDENGWYESGNGYSVIIPMKIFEIIHTEEFKTKYPILKEKIMTQGLESLNREENNILNNYFFDPNIW